ncbi:MAG: hypothetical protein GYB66_06545 [Chloroflexi bacterium]|nr:hypothetical protein [Chloroflexota bacterium]
MLFYKIPLSEEGNDACLPSASKWLTVPMSLLSISQILLLVFWFAFTALVFILALIARFYETSSGQKTYYRLYVVPILTMGFASARYASIRQWGGDWLADLFSFIGGMTTLTLSLFLYRQMTNGRKT